MFIKDKKLRKKKIKNIFNRALFYLFIKNGSKTNANKIYKKFFYYLCNKFNLSHHTIFNELIKKLHVSYELRIVKYRKHTNIVPFPLKRSRRFFLNVKWLFDSIKLDKRYVPFYIKLSDEVLKIIKNEDSHAKKVRDNIEFSILKYKTNIHYRWY